MASILTAQQIREYISDYPEKNLLLDDIEFSDGFIELSMDLAVSEFNSMSPRSNFMTGNFPSMSILMFGTVWQMFQGRMALMARNHLSYSDGGLQIPVEEKYELYKNIADNFKVQFSEAASRLKVNLNMEAGWGEIRSDESTFPIW